MSFATAMGVTVGAMESFARAPTTLSALPHLLSQLNFAVSKIQLAHDMETADPRIPQALWRGFMDNLKEKNDVRQRKRADERRVSRQEEIRLRNKRQKVAKPISRTQELYNERLAMTRQVTGEAVSSARAAEIWQGAQFTAESEEINTLGRNRKKRQMFVPMAMYM